MEILILIIAAVFIFLLGYKIGKTKLPVLYGWHDYPRKFLKPVGSVVYIMYHDKPGRFYVSKVSAQIQLKSIQITYYLMADNWTKEHDPVLIFDEALLFESKEAVVASLNA